MFNRKVRGCAQALSALAFLVLLPCPAWSAKLVLKNGLELVGKPGSISGVAENPMNSGDGGNGPVPNSLVMLMDDQLTRVFVSKYQVLAIEESPPLVLENIKIQQRVVTGRNRVAGVGSIGKVTPWDNFGRRIVTMGTLRGNIQIIQGITEVTPKWTKVESLVGGTKQLTWDMRIATSSIPYSTLSKVLMNNINPKVSEQRLSIFRLYLQAERYSDARRELEQLLKDFPELADLKNEVKALRQLGAKRLLKEIELRSDAGQHQLAYRMLSSFPDEGIAAQLLLKVQDRTDQYETRQKERQETLDQFDAQLKLLKDPAHLAAITPIREELGRELSMANFDRVADFRRLVNDDKLLPTQKLSLAISGWLLGSGSGTQNFAVAISLCKVRNLIKEYISSKDRGVRAKILASLQEMEGATPSYLAKLLAHMKPPLSTEAPEDEVPGYFKLTVPGLQGGGDIEYHVQLPPEYDPHRRYPTILTLGGIGTGPERQIDWWAGGYNDRMKMRLGQGARRGYIVISPKWLKPHQRKYEYSAREHAAVLYSLRDACRRFSVDTDRVFLSGHSIGGDAVWDIGLAHPDLWAGVLPIVPVAGKYVARYWENAKYVSLYFVMGELDGNKLGENKRDFDRYLKKPGFDTMLVEYRGRGHEHFADEIQRMFSWMELHKRDFFPQEFTTSTLRPWDNFFWWVELNDFPSNMIVTPARFDELNRRVPRPVQAEARLIPTNNGISLQSAANNVTLWLSPEIVDFEKPLHVRIRRKSTTHAIEPNAETLLEDVRTRGDRYHPFWAKLEF